MIIKTEQGKKYIVKVRTLYKYFDKKTIDNYGRMHRMVWKEPVISCTVKEFNRDTESYSQWCGTSWCRYTDNFDEKKGIEIALKRALDIAVISESDKKFITQEVMAHTKIHCKEIVPFMKNINKTQFLEEIGLA